MTDTKPTLDEQIAHERDAFELHAQIHGEADPMMAEKIASLEELKRIHEAEMPVEPERIRSDYFLSEHRKVTDYIDALKAYALRKEVKK
jgi:DNA-binding HxlR family transcriptional regulator